MPHPEPAGIEITEGRVLPEWIDLNGHMNVAWYVLAFDQAVDALFAEFGVTDEYIRSGAGSTFAVECHVTYQRELREHDPYRVTATVLGYDEKRVHQFQRMYHATEGWLAATAEWMNLHVSLETRRVAPWPAEVLRAVERFTQRQPAGHYPDEAGRRMGMEKPLYTLPREHASG